MPTIKPAPRTLAQISGNITDVLQDAMVRRAIPPRQQDAIRDLPQCLGALIAKAEAVRAARWDPIRVQDEISGLLKMLRGEP